LTPIDIAGINKCEETVKALLEYRREKFPYIQKAFKELEK
jgi:RNA processing factor Prp31